jgi:hypothetical protein
LVDGDPPSPHELARKQAIRKIIANDPSLGRYLATTVKTGTFCSYVPDPRMVVSWEL